MTIGKNTKIWYILIMNKWTVELTKTAYKQFKKLPGLIQELTDEAIFALELEGVMPKFWNCKKIGEDEYRVRLNYHYRMKYKIKNTQLIIEVFYIGHRKDAYRKT